MIEIEKMFRDHIIQFFFNIDNEINNKAELLISLLLIPNSYYYNEVLNLLKNKILTKKKILSKKKKQKILYILKIL